jgi:hypothetical protein
MLGSPLVLDRNQEKDIPQTAGGAVLCNPNISMGTGGLTSG